MTTTRAWVERHWMLVVLLVALATLTVRLALIAHSGGGSDLRIYVHFARLLRAGADPYDAPPGGAVDPVYGDNPPLLLALFAGLLELRDAPGTLRIAFALADAATVALLGTWPGRPTAWRAGLMTFYGFSPFVLYSWTAHAEDKTLTLLALVCLLRALDRGGHAAAWALTAGLAAFKWLGAFWALPLALATLRARGPRPALLAVVGFAAAFALSHLPLFPSNLEAYARRAARTQIDPPIHAALLEPLAELGLYAPWLARGCAAAALVAVYAALARRRLRPPEAVVLSLVAGYAFLPDQSDNRVLLLAMAVLLVVRLGRARLAVLWALSCAAAAVVAAQSAGALEPLLGAYGSLRHVAVVNAVLLWPLGLLAADVLARRRRPAVAPSPAVAVPPPLRPDRRLNPYAS